ncbi:Helicase-like transcription factor chr28 [Thalictrum thalictroides]|uniref:Helicase-like transcription factor chr28 n=1 Tax=Thalictrum thalictroides TaxID=46969 RepID=A0A7J6VLR7_THATH|nr:Helicase-like transcription factor chr28 [Thalictrum thalictroides]
MFWNVNAIVMLFIDDLFYNIERVHRFLFHLFTEPLAWLSLKETTSVHCLGGILADDQGLGKTISMIALILLQKHIQSISATDDLQTVKTEAFNLDDDDDGISESVNLNQSGEADEVK